MSALGRRLTLPMPALRRDCQFVKKVMEDPTLTGNTKDKPTYLRGDEMSEEGRLKDPERLDGPRGLDGSGRLDGPGRPGDPRLPRSQYEGHTRQITTVTLKGTCFLWDTNSKGQPPPLAVLINGFPTNIISKALLVNLIAAILDRNLVEQIKEVKLHQGNALLLMDSPESSSMLVRRMRKVDGWSASFDPDGITFKSLLPRAPEPDTIPLPSIKEEHRRMRCDRRVPCIVIPYTVIPKYESQRDVGECLKKCRIYNVILYI